MTTSSIDPPIQSPQEQSAESAWHALWHRWFIQYNPLYLLSAALVLVGVITLSRAMADAGTTWGQLGVSAISEIYAWALIGGAAFLVRIKLRRPAVMLALLTVLYQGDLTLHNDTAIYLGAVGAASSVLWLVGFGAKLYALGRAMRLRLSPSAFAAPMIGALGIVLIPRCFHELRPSVTSQWMALWIFAVFASALWTNRSIASMDPLDAWSSTVLRRASRATWALLAALMIGHVAFWSLEYSVSLSALIPIVPLLLTRWIRREAGVWAIVVATVAWCCAWAPGMAAMTSLVAAAVLALRALRLPSVVTHTDAEHPDTPYRTAGSMQPPQTHVEETFMVAERSAAVRMLTGSFTCLVVAMWTLGWAGGHLPPHIVWLDVAATLGWGILVWRYRSGVAALSIAMLCGHLGIRSGLIALPTTLIGWGGTSVGLGFALLAALLVGAWWTQRRAASEKIPIG